MKFKTQKLKAMTVLFLIIIIPIGSFSQTDWDLKRLLDSAKTNNSLLKSINQKADKEILNGKTVLMPKTGASFMLGQYNSYYAWDNNLTVSQSIPYPTLFREEKILGEKKAQVIKKDYDLAWLDLKTKIRMAYDSYQYCMARIDLLKSQDSLLQEINKKVGIQKELQDITRFDYSVVQTRQKVIQNQIDLNWQESENQKNALQGLVQFDLSQSKITIEKYEIKLISNVIRDSSLSHPILSKFDSEISVLDQEKQVQKARNLPEFTFSYFNQTLVGVQNVYGYDKVINQSNRMQGIQLGVDFALFNKGYKNAQKVKDLEQKQLSYELNNQTKAFESRMYQLTNQYGQYLKSLELYENQILPESRLMEQEGRIAWQSGSISLLDYFQIKEMTWKTEFEYLEIKHKINQTALLHQWYIQK
jgi:cobalt-zinc-cadmium resistance protein CzcA